MSQRIALGIEYDGSRFAGWQVQHHAETVQQAVEAALSVVADRPVSVACAGRTDTGVHALEQVVHFDCDVKRDLRAWVFGTNSNLPKAVSVLWAKPVPADFHARYSALARRYRYVILSRPVRPTFLARRVTWDYRTLDERRMRIAAGFLLGEHDFSAFRAVSCQARTAVRTISQLDVQRHGDFIVIDVEANAFLHHMVRNIAGVLMAIGAGEREVDWAKAVLESRDRRQGGVTAPPYGLYLMRVTYPAEYGINAGRETLLESLPVVMRG